MLDDAMLRMLNLGHVERERFVANTLAAGGAVVLDAWNSEWIRKVDLKKLADNPDDIGIAEQIFGSVEDARNALNLSEELFEKLGFSCPWRTHTTMLKAAWKYEVVRRITAP